MDKEKDDVTEEVTEENIIKTLDEIEEEVLAETAAETETDKETEEVLSDLKEDDEEYDDEEENKDDEETTEEEPEEEVAEENVDKTILDYASVDEYVLDKLPTIKVYGQEGEDEETKEFEIKTAEDLPDDFVPRSYKDQSILNKQLAKQEILAEKLSNEYETNISEAKNVSFREELENAWEREIAEAVDAGELPAIKAKEGSKDYWEDEGVKAVADVIQFMGKENERLAKLNAPYRIQSFMHAKQLMDATNLQTETKQEEKRQSDIRKVKGGMVASSSSNSAPKQPTASPYYQRGDDIETVASKALDDLLNS